MVPVAAGATNKSNDTNYASAAAETKQPQPKQSKKTPTGLWKLAAEATVAELTINMRKDTARTPTTAEKESSRPVHELCQEEIQEVMKDRILSREEKQQQLHDIRAKYQKRQSSVDGGAGRSDVRRNRAAVSLAAASASA